MALSRQHAKVFHTVNPTETKFGTFFQLEQKVLFRIFFRHHHGHYPPARVPPQYIRYLVLTPAHLYPTHLHFHRPLPLAYTAWGQHNKTITLTFKPLIYSFSIYVNCDFQALWISVSFLSWIIIFHGKNMCSFNPVPTAEAYHVICLSYRFAIS